MTKPFYDFFFNSYAILSIRSREQRIRNSSYDLCISSFCLPEKVLRVEEIEVNSKNPDQKLKH